MSPQNQIQKAMLTFQLTEKFGTFIDFKNIAPHFGWKARVGKEEIEKVKKSGLKVFKFDDSNKAPTYVFAADFADFVMKKLYVAE